MGRRQRQIDAVADVHFMTNSPNTTLRIPPEIREAIEAYCVENGISLSRFLLEAACEKIGKPELSKKIQPANRPKKPKK
jgi:hypothetical protein